MRIIPANQVRFIIAIRFRFLYIPKYTGIQKEEGYVKNKKTSSAKSMPTEVPDIIWIKPFDAGGFLTWLSVHIIQVLLLHFRAAPSFRTRLFDSLLLAPRRCPALKPSAWSRSSVLSVYCRSRSGEHSACRKGAGRCRGPRGAPSGM